MRRRVEMEPVSALICPVFRPALRRVQSHGNGLELIVVLELKPVWEISVGLKFWMRF